MGLRDDINNINSTMISEAQKKRIEREQAKKQKLINEVIKKHFVLYFEDIYKKNSVNNATLFILKNRSDIIIKLDNKYKKMYNRHWTDSETDFIYNNYFKWMQQVKKDFETINKIEIKQQKELEKNKKQEQKQEQELEENYKKTKSNINTIILVILCIIFSPIIFLIALLIEAMK